MAYTTCRWGSEQVDRQVNSLDTKVNAFVFNKLPVTVTVTVNHAWVMPGTQSKQNCSDKFAIIVQKVSALVQPAAWGPRATTTSLGVWAYVCIIFHECYMILEGITRPWHVQCMHFDSCDIMYVLWHTVTYVCVYAFMRFTVTVTVTDYDGGLFSLTSPRAVPPFGMGFHTPMCMRTRDT
jgi:hypothetical protein